MTRDEAVTRVRRKLGFNTSLDASVIIDAMKDAQVSLEKEPELPYFLRTEYSSIQTAATEERVPLPADWIMAVEDSALWRFDETEDTKWKEIIKFDLDALRIRFAGAEDAAPQAYALDSLYFRLFPTPDKAYTLKTIYYAKDILLDTNIENGWLKEFPLLLISLAIKEVTEGTRDVAAHQLAEEREISERSRLRLFIVARETANLTYQMGGAH